mmetsp:Transcript_24256/g.62605  ORF Transcript_24256/g.62605 Transcript_24256/m.62605 type:complete len:248 (+) Transcript_24256:84-827(+)
MGVRPPGPPLLQAWPLLLLLLQSQRPGRASRPPPPCSLLRKRASQQTQQQQLIHTQQTVPAIIATPLSPTLQHLPRSLLRLAHPHLPPRPLPWGHPTTRPLSPRDLRWLLSSSTPHHMHYLFACALTAPAMQQQRLLQWSGWALLSFPSPIAHCPPRPTAPSTPASCCNCTPTTKKWCMWMTAWSWRCCLAMSCPALYACSACGRSSPPQASHACWLEARACTAHRRPSTACLRAPMAPLSSSVLTT